MNISVADTSTTSDESIIDIFGPGSRSALGYAVYISPARSQVVEYQEALLGAIESELLVLDPTATMERT